MGTTARATNGHSNGHSNGNGKHRISAEILRASLPLAPDVKVANDDFRTTVRRAIDVRSLRTSVETPAPNGTSFEIVISEAQHNQDETIDEPIDKESPPLYLSICAEQNGEPEGELAFFTTGAAIVALHAALGVAIAAATGRGFFVEA